MDTKSKILLEPLLLYSQRYVNQIHDYHKELFTKMIAAGAYEA